MICSKVFPSRDRTRLTSLPGTAFQFVSEYEHGGVIRFEIVDLHDSISGSNSPFLCRTSRIDLKDKGLLLRSQDPNPTSVRFESLMQVLSWL